VRLKKTVGTPQMKGHHLYQSEMTWDATHSLFVTSNYRPQVAETDTGTWRRLALVTFPYRYTNNPEAPHERKGDGTLRQRIKQDPEILKAVMKWIIDGAKKFYETNLIMPDHPNTVIEDTRAWRAASDMILSFWDDQLEAEADSHVMSADLFNHFRSWMEAQGNRPWSEKVFTARFADHSETVSARVEKRKIRSGSTTAGRLSRPIGTGGTTPGSYQAWLGVRFREDDDPLS
jgi:putative DNA primase/helicase